MGAAFGEDGLCCSSGMFDACGICDGDGSTCNVAAPAEIPTSAIEGSLTAEAIVNNAVKAASVVGKLKSEAANNCNVPEAALSATLEVQSGSRRRLLGRFRRRLNADKVAANIEFNQIVVLASGADPVDALTVGSTIVPANPPPGSLLDSTNVDVSNVASKAV